MQPLGRDMPVALGEQQARERNPLACRPQARTAQQLGDVTGRGRNGIVCVGQLFHDLATIQSFGSPEYRRKHSLSQRRALADFLPR
jgi:hypothetical protein